MQDPRSDARAGREPSAARFFDRFAEQFDTLYDERRGAAMRWFDRRFRSDMFVRFAMTFEALGDLNGKSVLDVGCGSGPYLAEALRQGADKVTGVDPAHAMLGIAASRIADLGATERSRLIEGHFPGPQIDAHDCAIVMGVMDYVEDAAGFLGALRPLVRERAVVSFPSHHWLRGPVRAVRYRLRRCPLYFYDEDSIRTVGASFGDIRIHKIPGAGMDLHVTLIP